MSSSSNPDRLIPGDIVLTRSSSLMGRLIRWGERSPHEPRSVYNHAALVAEPPARIVESAFRVRLCSLWDYHLDDGIIAYRPPYASEEDRRYVIAYALRWVGAFYPTDHLLFYLIDNKIFRGRTVARRLLPHDKGVCSSLVAFAFRELRMSFGADEPDPDDIHDYCEAHPESFPRVFYQERRR